MDQEDETFFEINIFRVKKRQNGNLEVFFLKKKSKGNGVPTTTYAEGFRRPSTALVSDVTIIPLNHEL